MLKINTLEKGFETPINIHFCSIGLLDELTGKHLENINLFGIHKWLDFGFLFECFALYMNLMWTTAC